MAYAKVDRPPIRPKSPTKSKVTVRGYEDQSGQRWVKVGLNGQSAIVPLTEMAASSVWSRLAKLGVTVTTSTTQNEIKRRVERLRKWERRVIASRPNWQSNVFFTPDGEAIGLTHCHRTPIISLRNPLNSSTNGSLGGWQRWVKRFSRKQPILKFLLAYSLASVLLELAPAEIGNPIMELVGPSSTGKTTFANAAISAWGGPKWSSNTWVESWSTTVNAIEDKVAQHAGTLLVLDEANLLKGAGRTDAAVLANAMWVLAEGRAKARKFEDSQPPCRLCTLSTSNQALGELLTNTASDERDALQVRVATIVADGGANIGVWRTLPAGCSTGQDAVVQLSREVEANYGFAGKAFAARIAEGLVADEEKLRERLSALMATFMEQVSGKDLSGLEARRARTFSLIYAAGRLAQQFGVLPTKGAGKAVISCFREMERSRQTVQAGNSTGDAITDYVSLSGSQLIDLDQRGQHLISSDEWAEGPGFLKLIDGHRYILVRKKTIAQVFGPNFKPVLRRLKGVGRLKCNAGSGLQYQCRLRHEYSKSRVYAIRL